MGVLAKFLFWRTKIKIKIDDPFPVCFRQKFLIYRLRRKIQENDFTENSAPLCPSSNPVWQPPPATSCGNPLQQPPTYRSFF